MKNELIALGIILSTGTFFSIKEVNKLHNSSNNVEVVEQEKVLRSDDSVVSPSTYSFDSKAVVPQTNVLDSTTSSNLESLVSNSNSVASVGNLIVAPTNVLASVTNSDPVVQYPDTNSVLSAEIPAYEPFEGYALVKAVERDAAYCSNPGNWAVKGYIFKKEIEPHSGKKLGHADAKARRSVYLDASNFLYNFAETNTAPITKEGLVNLIKENIPEYNIMQGNSYRNVGEVILGQGFYATDKNGHVTVKTLYGAMKHPRTFTEVDKDGKIRQVVDGPIAGAVNFAGTGVQMVPTSVNDGTRSLDNWAKKHFQPLRLISCPLDCIGEGINHGGSYVTTIPVDLVQGGDKIIFGTNSVNELAVNNSDIHANNYFGGGRAAGLLQAGSAIGRAATIVYGVNELTEESSSSSAPEAPYVAPSGGHFAGGSLIVP